MIKKVLFAVIVFILFISWSSDPGINTPLCLAPGSQYIRDMVGDGAGGAIIAWTDSRGGDVDVYMQRLSASGAALWGTNGRLIYGGANTQLVSNLVADGSGAVLCVVGNETVINGNIYAGRVKKVNSSGSVVWTSDVIDNTMPAPGRHAVVSDGSGGVLLFWAEETPGDTKIYGQHVDSSGNIVWAGGGIPVSTIAGNQYRAYATADGQGGAFVAWVNWSENPLADYLYMQRIDGSGNLLWGTEGVMVREDPTYPYYIKLHRDVGMGVYIAWFQRDDYNNVFMQHLNSSGNKLWAADGVRVYRHPYYGFYCEPIDLVPDKAGGLYMLVESRYADVWGYCFYEADLQRVDSSGNTPWGSKGAAINSDVTYMNTRLAAGTGGKAIVAWSERISGEVLLKAQLFNSAGTPLWAADGLTVSDANISLRNYYIGITSNGAGGAIVAWDNGLTSDKDLYAQNICASGGIGSCALPIAVIQGDRFGGIAPAEIQFDGSDSYDPDGKVVQWDWDLGDGTNVSGAKVTHIYNDIGVYKVKLRVRDNSGQWSKPAKASVKTFSIDALTAVFDFNTDPVKAKNRGQASVRASLYDKPRTAEERPIPIDLGLTFETDKGSWQDELNFYSTTYARTLSSETTGTATVSAVLEDKVLGTAQVTFAWPLPPANVTVNLEVVRSLFMGKYDAHITWSKNPAEVFTPAKYRVYRSTNGSAFDLVAEVDAATFYYLDDNLPAGNEYSWAVAMVDEDVDESDLAVVNKNL